MNDAKNPTRGRDDVLSVADVAPRLAEAISALTDAPHKKVYIGEDGQCQAVLVSVEEYGRWSQFQVEHYEVLCAFHDEFVRRLPPQTAPGDLTPVELAELCKELGIDLGIDLSATAPTTTPQDQAGEDR